MYFGGRAPGTLVSRIAVKTAFLHLVPHREDVPDRHGGMNFSAGPEPELARGAGVLNGLADGAADLRLRPEGQQLAGIDSAHEDPVRVGFPYVPGVHL